MVQVLDDKDLFILDICHYGNSKINVNSFAANVADRRRHSRLPTSPIGDLDHLPIPVLIPSFTDVLLSSRLFFVLISQILNIY